MPKTVRVDTRVQWCHSKLLVLASVAMALAAQVETRWARVRAAGDRGSESVEKAVLVAIGLAVVIGLGAAIRAVVQKYQGQLE
ncbi:hypothetical protein BAY61_18160 [Prauserella marina]|uniref:Uncharacterized protein n=1 Tax=Prauserella marina TaxID=530584 RepID=A0A222VRN8_9PSEU|nr:hypothetical protein [Prauserella marina]ASR36606.1 hypothetical protein BAY61_18160 [Prauserella marina]PWV74017.1 hypothetical protein DES30_108191 [Prauserella marina]SDD60996.1 hypothetical protein SAMN05421630_110192 [Prauserella marina]